MDTYRTPQFRTAHEILRIMREENGKPWIDNRENVSAIFAFIYANQPLPRFMRDCARQMKEEIYPVVSDKIQAEG